MNEPVFMEKRRGARQYVQCPTKFILDADVMDAKSMDFSDGGVRLRLEQPVKVVMRVKIGDYEDEREARLVWAKRDGEGRMEYGLEYAMAPGKAPAEPLSEPANVEPDLTPEDRNLSYPPMSFMHLWW